MIKLVDQYIIKTVLASIGLVTLLLAGLQIFILFVNQLDDLGRADFGILQVALFVLLQMPYQVYLFFPMASMLGCLVGLGIMANNRELIIMRAAGMSVSQITGAVLKAAIFLVIIVTISGELLIPPLSHFANDQRVQALSGGQALRTAQGVWLRYHNDFISIGTVAPNNTLKNVVQFRFDANHKMRLARKINYISFIDKAWHAYDIHETIIDDNHTQTRTIAHRPWDVSVKPAILNLSTSAPDEMTLDELRQYLQVKKSGHQAALTYQMAYWQRLLQPLTTIVMMILAIPFIFGPLRTSTMGSKLLTGATVGFGFHIINRFFGPLIQVLQWPPLIAALGPTVLFSVLGLYLIKRVR